MEILYECSKAEAQGMGEPDNLYHAVLRKARPTLDWGELEHCRACTVCESMHCTDISCTDS